MGDGRGGVQGWGGGDPSGHVEGPVRSMYKVPRVCMFLQFVCDFFFFLPGSEEGTSRVLKLSTDLFLWNWVLFFLSLCFLRYCCYYCVVVVAVKGLFVWYSRVLC